MKGKNLSKVLAFLLAAVMIFSALPLMAFASDETANIYTVSNESPAIPMTAGTKIAVADLAVTFSDGTVVAGDALTWASSADSVVIKDGYIIAKEAGPVKLTVTAEGKTRNVYAAVATKEDAAKGVYKFYIGDFSKGTMPEDWAIDTTYADTISKNGFVPYNQIDPTSDDTTYIRTGILTTEVSRKGIDAEGNPIFTYTGSDRQTNWQAHPYFKAGIFADTMQEAIEKGIISNVTTYLNNMGGGYIPFASLSDKVAVKGYYYVDASGAECKKTAEGATIAVDENGDKILKSYGGNETGTSTYMYSTNNVFNDFSNYTVGTKFAKVANYGYHAAYGLMGRVTYGSESICDYNTLIVGVSNGGKYVNYRFANSAISRAVFFRHGSYGSQAISVAESTTVDALVSPVVVNKNATNFGEFTTKFNGTTATLVAGDYQVSYDGVPVNTGSIGFVAESGCSFAFNEIYAAINSEYLVNIPEAIEVYYTVSYGSPAIPMNVNTAVDLDFINVEMDSQGTIATGDKIEWNAAKQENLYLNKEGNKVSVYAAGNYKLTATANGVTKNVWIVAKTADATEFNIVDYDFTTEKFNSNEWQLLEYASAGGGAVGTVKPMDGTANLFVDKSGSSGGYIQITKDSTGSLLINTSEIFKDFRDYTVIFEAYQAGNTSTEYTGTGSAARVALSENGTLDPNQNSILSFIIGSAKARIQSHRGSWWAGGVTTNSDGVVSGAANFIWNNKNYHKVVSVYQGDNFVYTFDNAEIFDLSKATTKVATEWAKDVNYAMNPGYPGMMSWKGKTYVRAFSVKLNSTDMPDAIAAEVAPVEPEAEIVITGEGDAEVEAVVGSENNYTVALAPAEGYKVKVGSLVINGKAVILGAEGDTTGRLYTFKSDDLNATTISVEYIPDDGTFNSMMLGATIPVNPEKKGIRFGARTDFIRRNGETGFLGDKLLVDGVVYEPTEVGMLFIPSVLIDGELTVNTERATRQAVSKVVKLTGDFSDIAITLVGIPESFFGVQISSRMYVAYEVDGETKYVYTEVIERSYNDVVAAIGK